MSGAHDIRAVGVVIPARDEQELISGCLAGVERALSALPGGIATAVWVVVDRSSDATAEIVRRRFAPRADRGYSINHRQATIGGLRHHATGRVRRLLTGYAAANIWLLHTDADTRVAADWAVAQIRHARAGAYAVAGAADLDTVGHLTPAALQRYDRLLAERDGGPGRHGHVYGANLGVRADVYDSVGGFSARPAGEDHDLVDRVVSAGFRVVHPTDVRVTTSGRLIGRAEGGLADLLAALVESGVSRAPAGERVTHVRDHAC